MPDDNQREELNQSLACISDRHCNVKERIVPVGVTLPNTNNNQKKRNKTRDKK
jgi:NifB/MoaA-like Fe-S oxidoreductase